MSSKELKQEDGEAVRRNEQMQSHSPIVSSPLPFLKVALRCGSGVLVMIRVGFCGRHVDKIIVWQLHPCWLHHSDDLVSFPKKALLLLLILAYLLNDLGPALGYIDQYGQEEDHDKPADSSNIRQNSPDVRVKQREKETDCGQCAHQPDLNQCVLLPLWSDEEL